MAEGDRMLGSLPEWDLADLYAGPQDPRLEQDLLEAERLAAAT
jgi:hypothetical protein